MNAESPSKKRKKPSVVSRIILSFFLVVGVLIVSALIFRDPIIEGIAERMLSSKLETKVSITKFHLGILKPSIRMQEVAIDNKEDPSLYLLKTGMIQIDFKIIPLLKKQIEISTMALDDIMFSVYKNGKPPAQSDDKQIIDEVKDIFNSLDTDEILTEYQSYITSIQKTESFPKKIVLLEQEVKDILAEIRASAKDINNTHNKTKQEIKSAESVGDFQKGMQSMQQLLGKNRQLKQKIETIQNKADTYAEEMTQYLKDMDSHVKNDVDRVVTAISNPQELATLVLTDIMKNIVKHYSGKHQKALNTMLDLLVKKQENTQSSEKNSEPKQAKDSDTQAHTSEGSSQSETVSTSSAQDEDTAYHFKIAQFQLTAGWDTRSLLKLHAQNITDELYTAEKPTTFTISSGRPKLGFGIEGKGSLSLYPSAKEMLYIALDYTAIPFILDDIKIIEIEKMESMLGGTIEVHIDHKRRSSYNNVVGLYEVHSFPVPNKRIGSLVAKTIDDNAPIEVDVIVIMDKDEIERIKIKSDIMPILAAVIKDIFKGAIEDISQGLRKDIEAVIATHNRNNIEKAKEHLTNVQESIGRQQEKIDDTYNTLNDTFRDINKKMSQSIREQVKTQINENIDALKQISPF